MKTIPLTMSSSQMTEGSPLNPHSLWGGATISVLGREDRFRSSLGTVNERTCTFVATQEGTSNQVSIEVGCLGPSEGFVETIDTTTINPLTTQGCTDVTNVKNTEILLSPAYNIDNLLFKSMIPSLYGIEFSAITSFYTRKLPELALEASSPDSAIVEAPGGVLNVLFSGGKHPVKQFNPGLEIIGEIKGAPFTNLNGPIGATSIPLEDPENLFLSAFFVGLGLNFATFGSVGGDGTSCSIVMVPVSRSTALANVLILLVPALVIGLRMLMRRGR